MRIVFMGTPSYATEILKKILQVHEVVGLFTQPDKPVGRKRRLTPPHIKDFVLNGGYKFPIFQPKTLSDDQIINQIKDLKPDFIIVAAYGQILPQKVLDISPCINLHASILPLYRGASPIQSAILENEKYSGVTAMMMEAGLDVGDMLGFVYIKLTKNITSKELFDKLSLSAGNLTLKVIEDFSNLYALSQSNSISSYAPKITKADGEVDIYKKSAEEIYTKFRAFNPWPGVFLPNGIKLIDFLPKHQKGEYGVGAIEKISEDEILVNCKDGVLAIKEVQPPSKKRMSAYSYVLGLRKRVGDKLY